MARHDALPPNLPPRGLRRLAAAQYIGVGATKFDELVSDGRMPRPIEVDGRRIWDRHEVDRAFDQLSAAAAEPKDETWSDVDAT